MIKKSYLFLAASIIVHLALLYILSFLPYYFSDNLFLSSIFLHVPSIILSVLGIYYGVKGVRKYKVSAKGIGAIVLNTIFMTYLIITFIILILFAFLFFLEIPL